MTKLKTEIFVKAYLKCLEIQGISGYVLQHGDDDAGDVLVKVSTFDGKASLLQREYNLETDERDWVRVIDSDEKTVDSVVKNQCKVDPDVWVLEIENPKGRDLLENLFLRSGLPLVAGSIN